MDCHLRINDNFLKKGFFKNRKRSHELKTDHGLSEYICYDPVSLYPESDTRPDNGC